MELKHITPILNVSNIGQSLAWFEKLGWKRCWTYNKVGGIAGAADSNEAGPAYFAAVANRKCEIFLCLDYQGGRGANGTWMSLWVATPAEVDAAYNQAVHHGITVTHPPTDEPWGCRECHIHHPDGHTFRVAASIRV
jgi:uncharacterized glyoxalase superfamily protein PhnB